MFVEWNSQYLNNRILRCSLYSLMCDASMQRRAWCIQKIPTSTWKLSGCRFISIGSYDTLATELHSIHPDLTRIWIEGSLQPSGFTYLLFAQTTSKCAVSSASSVVSFSSTRSSWWVIEQFYSISFWWEVMIDSTDWWYHGKIRINKEQE